MKVNWTQEDSQRGIAVTSVRHHASPISIHNRDSLRTWPHAELCGQHRGGAPGQPLSGFHHCGFVPGSIFTPVPVTELFYVSY